VKKSYYLNPGSDNIRICIIRDFEDSMTIDTGVNPLLQAKETFSFLNKHFLRNKMKRSFWNFLSTHKS
jgi:hypothetical protein